MHPFVVSLLGGVLLGLAAAALLVFSGRVAGASGILEGVLQPTPGQTGWKVAFVAGLLAGGATLLAVMPEAFPAQRAPLAVLLVSGVLVGFGARLGGGCTSGHGVCGVARLSSRGITATVVFMLTGAFSVALLRHVL